MTLEQLSESLKGVSIVTRYGARGSKTYQIDRIDFERSPTSSFSKKNGSEITFIDYY
jgi:aubergine-like protein